MCPEYPLLARLAKRAIKADKSTNRQPGQCRPRSRPVSLIIMACKSGSPVLARSVTQYKCHLSWCVCLDRKEERSGGGGGGSGARYSVAWQVGTYAPPMRSTVANKLWNAVDMCARVGKKDQESEVWSGRKVLSLTVLNCKSVGGFQFQFQFYVLRSRLCALGQLIKPKTNIWQMHLWRCHNFHILPPF